MISHPCFAALGPVAEERERSGSAEASERGISPVVGVVLMIALTILLASVIGMMVLSLDDQLREPDFHPHENPWADDPLLGPENPIAGAEDVRYRVYFEVNESGGGETPLNYINVSVETEDDMFSGTTAGDLESMRLLRANGTVVDLAPDEDWKVEETRLQIKTEEGVTFVDEGDAVEIIFGGVDNPAKPGTYPVNISSTGAIEDQHGELEIIPG